MVLDDRAVLALSLLEGEQGLGLETGQVSSLADLLDCASCGAGPRKLRQWLWRWVRVMRYLRSQQWLGR